MKKSLLIAFVGFMFFAFASCGESNSSNSKDEEKITGTKEYKDAKKFLNKFETALKKAKDCESLEKAWLEAIDYKKPDYNEDEMMTDDEKEKIKKINEKIVEIFQGKVDELCKEY